jgi:hypothetical protein
MEMTTAERQRKHRQRRAEKGEVELRVTLPAGIKGALKRLGAFYGGSEREMLARFIADAERDTLATLSSEEREAYFGLTG